MRIIHYTYIALILAFGINYSCINALEVPFSSFEKIFEEQSKSWQDLSKSNPKMMIMFSGTPGMGKTTLAKALEQHFQALRISSDETRDLLKKNNLDLKLAHDYVSWCLQKLSKESSNHLIILDCSIDRAFDSYVKKFADQANYGVFIIRMIVDRNIVEKRIKSRGKSVEMLLKGANQSWQDYEYFGQTHKLHYLFENNVDLDTTTDIKKFLDPLISQISNRLKNNAERS